MPLTTKTVRFGDDFSGTFSFPERARTPLPALVVIQELWGVDDHIEDVTRRFASAGYAALAPDLYARGGERPELLTHERIAQVKRFLDENPLAFQDSIAREAALAKLPETRDDLSETFELLRKHLNEPAPHVEVLVAAARWLREAAPETRGQKIGSVGFCLGGALSLRLAGADPALAGAAVFYGVTPPGGVASAIRCPVTAFYGENDARVNGTIDALVTELGKNAIPLETTIYPGAGHAFFNDTRASYDVEASRDAFTRVLGFFARVLA